uniref:Uncharacterized protein n=1 Tax=Oryza punctata TaxID=4537 RepID=A0A0E0LP69_ORYPU
MTRRARRDGAGSSRRRRGRIISRPFLNSITSACPATFGSKQSTSELNDSLESRNAFISLSNMLINLAIVCVEVIDRFYSPLT